MDNMNSMSIFGLSSIPEGSAGATHSWPISAENNPSAFKHFLKAHLTTQTAQTAQRSTVHRESPSNVDQNAMISSFLTRLWQTEPTVSKIDFSTPVKFIHSIAEPAKEAAKLLGTSPEAVIAIAALETGWGKHIISLSDGISSNNLFGIKSTKQHTNSTVIANTTEYINGEKLTLKQPFRTYATVADSVSDFAEFIRSNPRYENALLNANDATIFVEQIHQAGYATDPNYASKVKSVMADVEKMMSSADYQRLN